MSIPDAIPKEVTDIGKFLAKPSQVMPIKDIGDGKHTALQQLVNIFTKKKEITRCDMMPYLRVINNSPDSAPINLPWFNIIISTPPATTNPPQANPKKWMQEKQREHNHTQTGQQYTP